MRSDRLLPAVAQRQGQSATKNRVHSVQLLRTLMQRGKFAGTATGLYLTELLMLWMQVTGMLYEAPGRQHALAADVTI